MLTQTQSLDYIALCKRDLILCEDAEHSTQDDFLRAFDNYAHHRPSHPANPLQPFIFRRSS
jgi:hypothetical protein